MAEENTRESILTDYLLVETTDEETAAYETALHADPALAVEAGETKDLHNAIIGALASRREQKLTPSRRDAILRELRSKPASAKSFSVSSPFTLSEKKRGNSGKWWLVSAAAAAIVLAVFYLPVLMPKHEPQAATSAKENPSEPIVSVPPAEPLPPESTPPVNHPLATGQDALATSAQTSLALPLTCGDSSLKIISDSIRGSHVLPSAVSVRVEELLNSFRLRPSGRSIVCRAPIGNWHPDKRTSGATNMVAGLSAEVIPCPWRPSSSLLFIAVQGSAHRETELAVEFEPNAKFTPGYRLFGYDNSAITSDTTGQTATLPPGKVAFVAIELLSTTPHETLGTLEWSINGQRSRPLDITFDPETEPSDDARFASLVCAYAAWLQGDSLALIDRSLLQGLARECSTDTLIPERADFLVLVEQSLQM